MKNWFKFDFNNAKDRKLLIYTVLEAVGLITIVILSGMMDFLHMEFDPSRLGTSTFWTEAILNAIIYTIALAIGYLSRLQREELKNETFATLWDQYLMLLKNKTQVFEYWVLTIFNRNTKKEFMRKRYERELYKLDRKYKDDVKLQYHLKCKHPDNYVYPDDPKLAEQVKKYTEMRLNYEAMLKDDFLEENVDSISIPYPYVDPNLFSDIFQFQFRAKYTEYKVSNDTAKTLPIRLGAKIVRSILIAALFALILFSPDTAMLVEGAAQTITFIVKYLFKIVITIWNFGVGIFLGKFIFNNNYILPIKNRNRILLQYIDYAHQNQVELTYSEQLLQKYMNMEIQQKDIEQKTEHLQQLLNQAEKKIS